MAHDLAHAFDAVSLSHDEGSALDFSAFEAAHASSEAEARSRALELKAQTCDNAAEACWYLARSLGTARDLPQDGEASLELLFQLIGALADLPSDIAAAPLLAVSGAREDGITELCSQLEAAREATQDALIDAELAQPRSRYCH